MHVKNRSSIGKILFLLLVLLRTSYLYSSEICVPAYYAPDALVYLAEELNYKIIIFLDGIQLEKTKKFKSEYIPDKENALDILKDFESEHLQIELFFEERFRIIFCVKKAKVGYFKELLNSTVIYENNRNYLKISNEELKKNLSINGFLKEKDLTYIDIKKFLNSETQWKVPCKFSEYITGLMNEYKFSSCLIKIADDLPEDLKKFIMIQQMDEHSNLTHKRIKDISKKIQRFEIEGRDEIRLTFFPARFTEKPEMETIGKYLLQKEEEYSIVGQSYIWDAYFWINWFMSRDSLQFLSFLFNNDLFDKTVDTKLDLIYALPSIIVSNNDINAIEFLIQNLEKIKIQQRKKDLIEGLSNFDKSLLPREILEILIKQGRMLGIEEIYVDSLNWIDNHLPDDYDRWKEFKIPEMKLIKEEKITVVTKEFNLKYYKYKESFEMPKIPLKRMEETNYSSPEKAYYSYLCSRNYDWYKNSIYDIDNLPFDTYTYDKLSIWKRWNDNDGYRMKIYYRVDVEEMGMNPPQTYTFFVRDLKTNKLRTTVLKKIEENNWRILRIETFEIYKLSNHILDTLLDDKKE